MPDGVRNEGTILPVATVEAWTATKILPSTDSEICIALCKVLCADHCSQALLEAIGQLLGTIRGIVKIWDPVKLRNLELHGDTDTRRRSS